MFSWREYPRAEYGGCVVKSKFVYPMQFDVNIQNIGIWFRERFISQEHANQKIENVDSFQIYLAVWLGSKHFTGQKKKRK